MPFGANAQRDSVAAAPQKYAGCNIVPIMWLRRSRRNCHFLPVSLFRETLPGLFLSLVSSYGEYEGAVRANIKGTYFPIVEIGMGVSNHTDEATNLHYKTNSPFFRVGLDYNILGDKISGNRVSPVEDWLILRSNTT